ncbi:ribonuclease R [Bacteroidota bacterium]
MDQKELVERLLKLFSGERDTLRLNEVAKRLSIMSDSPEYLLLKSVLNELCAQNILQKSSRRRYSLNNYDKVTTLEGVMKISNNSGVLWTSKAPAQKIRIKRRHLNTAFDGDTVLVRILKAKKGGKARGEVVKILERNDLDIVGKIEFYDNIYFFIPESDKYYVDFLINPKKLNGAEDGDKVKVRLIYWDNPQKSPQAEVVEIFSKSSGVNEIQGELDAIIEEFNLPDDFQDSVKSETKNIKNPDIKKLLIDRLDLRKETIITIDPEDAKDFDDALSLKMLDNGNQLLGVHIADVSYYVREGTALDSEAYARGTSVYLADRVVPMLPEELSNDLCSLKPNRVRLAFSVMMELTPTGIVKFYEIGESIIKSSRRFSYKEVQEIIDNKSGEMDEIILPLYNLTAMLRKKRFDNGGVDFESIEVKFELDENKNPVKSELRKGTNATQLVEECMLLANKKVAEYIYKLSKEYRVSPVLPFLYRVHDEPMPDKLANNLEFLKALGAKFKLKNKSSKEINRIVKLFDNKPEKPVAHQVMLRSMAKAEYSHRNIGHFGLGFKDYTHFTSPIRRYPDLIVHRLVKEYLSAKPGKKRLSYYNSVMEEIGKHNSEKEREAVEAERASVRLVQTFMARKYLGQEIEGTISGITNFGVFVLLDEFYGEGLVHIRDLRDDYYYFDEKNFRLIGKRKKRILKLGGRIKVRIIHVNIDTRKIELEFVEQVRYYEQRYEQQNNK